MKYLIILTLLCLVLSTSANASDNCDAYKNILIDENYQLVGELTDFDKILTAPDLVEYELVKCKFYELSLRAIFIMQSKDIMRLCLLEKEDTEWKIKAYGENLLYASRIPDDLIFSRSGDSFTYVYYREPSGFGESYSFKYDQEVKDWIFSGYSCRAIDDHAVTINSYCCYYVSCEDDDKLKIEHRLNSEDKEVDTVFMPTKTVASFDIYNFNNLVFGYDGNPY